MPSSPLFRKLQTIAEDFTCGVWGSPEVLSPQRHVEKADAEYDAQPGRITAARRDQARGKWALVFGRPPESDSRGARDSTAPLEALIAFTPEEVTRMDPHEIRKMMIGVLAEREFHEVLEWAQLRSVPNVPIVDPHRRTDDLFDIVERVAQAVIDHSAV
jgi:hypothetical protein